MRVENGMITIPHHMHNKMVNEVKTYRPKIDEKDFVFMNSPVIKI